MTRSVSLSGSDWTLSGTWQHQLRLAGTLGLPLRAIVPPIPATVPGAVQHDLLRAGWIGDWNCGLNAMKAEWVANREWSLRRSVTVPADFDGRLTLECDGLDYSGRVMVSGSEIGTFEGTHFRHRFDLTGRVRPGETFDLEFIFDQAPAIDGVYGHTSRTKIFKPRFGYCWDWCTRLVNLGIWQDLRLVCRGAARFTHCRVLPRMNENLVGGSVRIAGEIEGSPAALRYVLRDEAGQVAAQGERPINSSDVDHASPLTEDTPLHASPLNKGGPRGGTNTSNTTPLNPPSERGESDPSDLLTISLDRVNLWWPSTMGQQPLYHLRMELLDSTGDVSDVIERTIGFKQVRWLLNPDSPPGARTYWCEINGRTTFLRGVNWVPLSPLYGTVSPQRYEAFLRLYRNMNVNVLRVWGGAILETPAFYDLCDRLGLLVWQEFPLSSSGIDNWPPEDPEVITQLERIAAEYIERRCHHACHLLWCGGNELQGAIDGGKVGIGKPVDESHPLMQTWARLVERLDPGKRFQPTSPTGPRFYADPKDFGKGLHHQTHGPWGNLPLSERFAYFNGDDSLFRSETGAPGCSSVESLERHRGDQTLWPPRAENPMWLTPAACWVPWDDVTREFGPIADDPTQLPNVVKASQHLQADSYRYLAESVRRRYPNCTGLLIWMGHDSVHCTANNSVIQIDAETKPAYDWLQRAYAARHVSLKHDSIHYRPGDPITAEAWIHRDEFEPPADGQVTISLRSLDGQVVQSLSAPVSGKGESIRVAPIDWPAPDCPERLFVIELVWENDSGRIMNRYLLSQQAEHPFAPMLSLPPAKLTAEWAEADQIRVRNDGPIAAIGVRVVPAVPDVALLTDMNSVILFPGESQSIKVKVLAVEGISGRGLQCDRPTLEMECFNAAARVRVKS
jgi:beta-mannosidase